MNFLNEGLIPNSVMHQLLHSLPAFKVGSFIAAPPYLMTTVLP